MEPAAPISADVQHVVIEIRESFYDFWQMPQDREKALPVFADHLQREGYTIWVRSAMAHLMGIPAAAPYWPLLRDLFIQEEDDLISNRSLVLSAQLHDPSICKTCSIFSDGKTARVVCCCCVQCSVSAGSRDANPLKGSETTPNLALRRQCS
jgi:hypothetical protein